MSGYNDFIHFQRNFGGNIDVTFNEQETNGNQRCNYTSDINFSSPYQEMYQNETPENNMPFYNNHEQQPMYYQNETSTSDNYYQNEESYYNHMYPQFNSTERRSGNNRSYVLPNTDSNESSYQFSEPPFQLNNSSMIKKEKTYISPISESEYENQKRREVRIERSNMTTTNQKSFFGQIFDSFQSFI